MAEHECLDCLNNTSNGQLCPICTQRSYEREVEGGDSSSVVMCPDCDVEMNLLCPTCSERSYQEENEQDDEQDDQDDQDDHPTPVVVLLEPPISAGG
jgi:hypothetical protein